MKLEKKALYCMYDAVKKTHQFHSYYLRMLYAPCSDIAKHFPLKSFYCKTQVYDKFRELLYLEKITTSVNTVYKMHCDGLNWDKILGGKMYDLYTNDFCILLHGPEHNS